MAPAMKNKIAVLLISMMMIVASAVPTRAVSTHKTTQNMANLVVFVRFQDDSSDAFNQIGTSGYKNYDTIKKQYDNNIDLNNQVVDSSFKAYMDEISFHQFEVNNYFPQLDENTDHVQALSLKHGEASYSSDYAILSEVTAAFEDGTLQMNNTAKLDYNETGVLDNLTVIIQSDTAVTDQNDHIMWPHHDTAPAMPVTIQGSQYIVSSYNFLNSYTISNGKNANTDQQGVIIHEYMHSLGLKDLYNNNGRVDVGNWDIMARSGRYPNYLLSYNRKTLGWIDIDTVSKSGKYTLDKVNKEDGNQAYIIPTPLSNSEFFVVEYRENLNVKAGYLGYGFDRQSMPGLLIYRVNTELDVPSNMGSDPYIYVFRPNGEANAIHAALVPADSTLQDNPRSFGNCDLTDVADQNAIRYTDGKNSGIFIDEVEIKGDQLSFQLTMPDYSSLDLWPQVGGVLDRDASSQVSTLAFDNLYTAAYTKMNSSANPNQIITQYKEGTQWKSYSNTIAGTSPELIEFQNKLYLFYLDKNFKPSVAVKEGQNWKFIASLNTSQIVDYFAVAADDAKLYITVTNSDQHTLDLYDLSDLSFQFESSISNAGWAVPHNLTLYEGNPILAFSQFGDSTNNHMTLYAYKNDAWETLYESSLSDVNRSDIVSDEQGIYIYAQSGYDAASAVSKIISYTDGKGQEFDVTKQTAVSSPQLQMVGKTLYVGYIDNHSTGYVYTFDDGIITPFHGSVSNNMNSLTLTAVENELYAAGSNHQNALYIYSQKLPALGGNNYLKALTVHGIPLDFQKETVRYQAEVENSVTSLMIDAEAEDPTARITVDQPEALQVGWNTITVTVLAENGEKRVYTIQIHRKALAVVNEDTFLEALKTYGIRKEKQYVKGFANTVKLQDAKDELLVQGYDLSLRDASGKKLAISNGMLIKTGYELHCQIADQSFTYTVIVNGDVNGDGKISSIDYLMIKDKIMGKYKFDAVQLKAADVNADRAVSSIDYLMIKDAIMGKIQIKQ